MKKVLEKGRNLKDLSEVVNIEGMSCIMKIDPNLLNKDENKQYEYDMRFTITNSIAADNLAGMVLEGSVEEKATGKGALAQKRKDFSIKKTEVFFAAQDEEKLLESLPGSVIKNTLNNISFGIGNQTIAILQEGLDSKAKHLIKKAFVLAKIGSHEKGGLSFDQLKEGLNKLQDKGLVSEEGAKNFSDAIVSVFKAIDKAMESAEKSGKKIVQIK